LSTLHYNRFRALWSMSGTTRVGQYQKVHFAIFWIFWCKMKITQADTLTIYCLDIQTQTLKANKCQSSRQNDQLYSSMLL